MADNYNAEVYLDMKKLDERKEILPNFNVSSSSFRIHRINFSFNCKTEIRIYPNFNKQTDDEILCRGTLPLVVNSLQINYDQQEIMPFAKMHTAIRAELKDWPHQWREQMIIHVMWRIWDMLKSVSPSNNILDVGIKVVVKYNGALKTRSEGRLHSQALFRMDIKNGFATSKDLLKMSPESTMVDSDDEDTAAETCPICFEGLFGYGRASIFLTCLHTFHGYCLWKWTRKKDNCPVCRFNLLPKAKIYRDKLPHARPLDF